MAKDAALARFGNLSAIPGHFSVRSKAVAMSRPNLSYKRGVYSGGKRRHFFLPAMFVDQLKDFSTSEWIGVHVPWTQSLCFFNPCLQKSNKKASTKSLSSNSPISIPWKVEICNLKAQNDSYTLHWNANEFCCAHQLSIAGYSSSHFRISTDEELLESEFYVSSISQSF